MASLKVGDTLQDIVAVLRSDFWTFFAIAAPFTLLVDMLLSLYGPPPPRTAAEFTPQAVLLLVVVPGVIGAIGQLAIVGLVARPGGAPRAALAAAFAAMPAYVVALLLMGMPGAIVLAALSLARVPPALALLALVIPAIYFTGRLFLGQAVAVVEGAGAVGIVRRSWQLTAGNGWTLALLVILALLMTLGAGALGIGIGAALASLLALIGLKSVAAFAAALVNAVLSTGVSVAAATAAATVYRKLA